MFWREESTLSGHEVGSAVDFDICASCSSNFEAKYLKKLYVDDGKSSLLS